MYTYSSTIKANFIASFSSSADGEDVTVFGWIFLANLLVWYLVFCKDWHDFLVSNREKEYPNQNAKKS